MGSPLGAVIDLVGVDDKTTLDTGGFAVLVIVFETTVTLRTDIERLLGVDVLGFGLGCVRAVFAHLAFGLCGVDHGVISGEIEAAI